WRFCSVSHRLSYWDSTPPWSLLIMYGGGDATAEAISPMYTASVNRNTLDLVICSSYGTLNLCARLVRFGLLPYRRPVARLSIVRTSGVPPCSRLATFSCNLSLVMPMVKSSISFVMLGYALRTSSYICHGGK